jgi:hypothetical protein
MSTSTATIAIVNFLNCNNCKVWRNNNIGVWDAKLNIYRKNPQQLKGVSDIIGLKYDGTFIAIEVKTGRDKKSIYQEIFIQDIIKHNGIALVVKDFDDFLKQWQIKKD